jgi:hypothetical protein
VPTSLSRTQLVLSEARPETLLPVELSIGARPARATLSRTQLSLADARPAGAAAARRMHDAGDAGEGAKRWMDGASEGDVGVGSEAGEAAVGEMGNSGGAAAAAMAGEAAGERAEEKRKSIGNATRWEPEILWSSNPPEPEIDSPKRRGREPAEVSAGSWKEDRLRLLFGTGGVHVRDLVLFMVVCIPYRSGYVSAYRL